MLSSRHEPLGDGVKSLQEVSYTSTAANTMMLVEQGGTAVSRFCASAFFLGILHVFFVFLRKMRDGLVTVW